MDPADDLAALGPVAAGVEVGGQSALLHALHDAPARFQQKGPVLVRRLAAGAVLEVHFGEVGQPLGKLEAHLMVLLLQDLLQPLSQERALVFQSLHKVLHVLDMPASGIVLAQDLHLLDDPCTEILKLHRRQLLIQRRPGHEVIEALLHVLHAAELFVEALVMRGIEGLEVLLDHQLAALPELPCPGEGRPPAPRSSAMLLPPNDAVFSVFEEDCERCRSSEPPLTGVPSTQDSDESEQGSEAVTKNLKVKRESTKNKRRSMAPL